MRFLKAYFSSLTDLAAPEPDGVFRHGDWIFYGICVLVGAICFQHFDLYQTAPQGVMMLESIVQGNFLNFYTYTEQYFGAGYNAIFYVFLSLWGIPVFLYNFCMGTPLPLGWIIGWYKVLLLVFGVLSAAQLMRIASLLKLEHTEKKLLLVLFATSPLLFWQLPMLGQYDVFSMFFTLCAFEFYLKKQLWRFTLTIAFAACFKNLAFFVFLPLLLLAEKRPFRIIAHGISSLVVVLIGTLPFLSDPSYTGRASFESDFIDRFFHGVFPAAVYPAGYFLVGFLLLLFWCYAQPPADEKEFQSAAVYAPMASFCIFFCFILWHPQWFVLLVPFLLLCIFVNARERRRTLLYIDFAMFFGVAAISSFEWTRCNDHMTIRQGLLYPWNSRFFSQSIEIKDLLGAGDPFPFLYSSILVASLLFYLWSCRPHHTKAPSEPIGRFDVYFRFAAVLLFYVLPAAFCFLCSIVQEKELLQKVKFNGGVVLWIDPNEEEWVTGRGKREGTFDIFLRSRHPVIAPFEQGTLRLGTGEIAKGRTLKLPLPIQVDPNPVGLALYFRPQERGSRGKTFLDLRKNGRPLGRITIDNERISTARYLYFMLSPGASVPDSVTVTSDAAPGYGLAMRGYLRRGEDNAETPDKAWIPDYRWLLQL